MILSGDTLRCVDDRSKPNSFVTPMMTFGIIRWKNAVLMPKEAKDNKKLAEMENV